MSATLLTLAQALAALYALQWLLGVLFSFKTSRPDGDVVSTPAYRRLMFHIMRGKAESVVYFDAWVNAEKLLPYVEAARASFGANLTHCVVAATGLCLARAPRINRFTSGQRLYARRGRHVTFSMKRGTEPDGAVARASELGTIKIEVKDGEDFPSLCKRINSDIRLQRSGADTPADKEYRLFNLLPQFVLRGAARLIMALDQMNLLPGFFIEGDGMFSSVFVANLGSIHMDAGYHHLYEYGNTPIFIMVGQVCERPVVVEGAVVARPALHLRFTFDERIDDGLNARHAMEALVEALEDPERWLGGLGPGPHAPLWPREAPAATPPAG